MQFSTKDRKRNGFSFSFSIFLSKTKKTLYLQITLFEDKKSGIRVLKTSNATFLFSKSYLSSVHFFALRNPFFRITKSLPFTYRLQDSLNSLLCKRLTVRLRDLRLLLHHQMQRSLHLHNHRYWIQLPVLLCDSLLL